MPNPNLVEPSQLSLSTHNQIAQDIVFIQRCLPHDPSMAAAELEKLKQKIAAIRAVPSRLIPAGKL
jgi:hypothetical protein